MNMVSVRTGCLLLCMLLFAFQTAHAQSIEDALRKADTQFNLSAYNTALNSYSEVLKKDPNNAYAFGRKGDCYVQLNQPLEALPWFDRAATTGRVDPEIIFRYGQALMMTADYVGAKKWFNYYAQNNPSKGQHFASMCDEAQKMVQKSGAFQAKSELLNTSSADYSPVFYGNRVVYSSARKDITRRAKKGDGGTGANEVFVTQRNPEDGMLQRPGFLIGDLQKSPTGNEGPVAYSGNGSRVAYCINKYVDGSRQISENGIEMSLYVAEVNSDGKWAIAQAFQYNSSDYAIGYPFLSDDGNTLYFASNMAGGLGGWDLYASSYSTATGAWGSPRNLGPTINTAGNEIAPFLDGNDIYFSSDWHFGLGGMDVFRADFKGSFVSNIVNMGVGVNSSRDDYGFILDGSGNFGYVTSNRSEGRGNEDIWQLSKGLEEFSITVRNQYQQPVPYADIDFSACGSKTVQTDENGYYAFAVSRGQANCSVTVRKSGLPTANVTINSSGEHNITVILGGAASNGGAHEALGVTIDANTSEPLYSVRVSAQPLPNGSVVQTYSSYTGQYVLNLEPSKQYYVTYTKDGYADASLTAFSGANGAQSTIAQLSLVPLSNNRTGAVAPPIGTLGATSPIGSTSPINTTPAASTQPYRPSQYNELPPLNAEPIASTPISQPNPWSPAATAKSPIEPRTTTQVTQMSQVMNGYSIQLSAPSADESSARMAKFEDLTSFGNLYTKPEGNLMKIRLGVFPTKSAADAVLKKVKAKQKDAFIVEEREVDATLAVEPTNALQNASSEAYSIVSEQKGSNVTAVKAPELRTTTRFAVQVASQSIADPVIMNTYGDLSSMGNIYTKPDNDMLRIRVGVWESLADAELAQGYIMAKGYKDAVVVVEKSGSDIPQTARPMPVDAIDPVPSPSTSPKNIDTPSIEKRPQPSKTAPSKASVPQPAPAKSPSKPFVSPSSVVNGDELPPLEDGPAPTVYSTPKTSGTRMMPIASGEVFMVRICSLKGDPGNFEVKKAEKAGGGKVDARIGAGGATVMLLTNLDGYDTAVIAKEKLIASGYKDAFVVKEINSDGILRKVE